MKTPVRILPVDRAQYNKDSRWKLKVIVYGGMNNGAKKWDDGKLYRAMRYLTIRQTQPQCLSKPTVRGGRQH